MSTHTNTQKPDREGDRDREREREREWNRLKDTNKDGKLQIEKGITSVHNEIFPIHDPIVLDRRI